MSDAVLAPEQQRLVPLVGPSSQGDFTTSVPRYTGGGSVCGHTESDVHMMPAVLSADTLGACSISCSQDDMQQVKACVIGVPACVSSNHRH